MSKIKSKNLHIGIFFMIFLFIFIVFAFKLKQIPEGFFCDEAVIGVRAYELIHGNFSNFKNIFFYQHFNYINGSLPVFANLPFVLIFGLNEFSTRITSVFFALLFLIVLFYILKKQKISFKTTILTIFIIAFTPIFFHLSRINFGHLPSLFFMLLGYLFYLYKKPILSGISFGISLYGYSGFVITVPLFIFFLLITELIKNNLNFKKYFSFIKLIVTFLLVSIPLILMIFFNKDYLLRLKDKDQQKQLNIKERIINFKKNYFKYYSVNYLFLKGEIDLPGSFVTRHSIRGSGELLKVSAFLILSSFIFFIFDKKRLIIFPFILMFIFYPLPDIITTGIKNPPYSFSIFSSFIFLPFLITYGLEKLVKLFDKNIVKKIFLIIILMISLFEVNILLTNYFTKYSLYSSDYWGWQYGPREIINYFKIHSKDYDELYMTGSFNAPEIFLKFYDSESKCSNCFIGGIDKYNKNKNQIFAITPEELSELKMSYKILNIIYYPDKKVAFYIITSSF